MPNKKHLHFWRVYGDSPESDEAENLIREAGIQYQFDGHTEFGQPELTWGWITFYGIDQIRGFISDWKEWKKEGKI